MPSKGSPRVNSSFGSRGVVAEHVIGKSETKRLGAGWLRSVLGIVRIVESILDAHLFDPLLL